MRLRSLATVLALLIVPLAGAHEWNFENRGELCAVAPGQYSPHDHSVGDNHTHWHHTAPSAAHVHWDPETKRNKSFPDGHDHPWYHTAASASGHNHYDPVAEAFVWYEAGHTHPSPFHDPCLQTRMDYPHYLASAEIPLVERFEAPPVPLDPLATLYPADDPARSRVYSGGEAYEFPLPVDAWKRQTSLVVSSDLQAAGMGFPGSGTRADPYIVEGYIIAGNLIIKNTSKCFIVKNNVVVNRVIVGPPIPDLPDIPLPDIPAIIDDLLNRSLAAANDTLDGTLGAIHGVLDTNTLVSLDTFLPAYGLAQQQALDLKAASEAQKAIEDAAQADRNAAKLVWEGDAADNEAKKAWFDAEEAEWQAAWDAFAELYFNVIQQTEYAASDFEYYASQYSTVKQPAKGHSSYVDYSAGTVTDLGQIDDAFQAYQQEDQASPTNDNVEGYIDGNPPPPNPPPGWWGSSAAWQDELAYYQDYQQMISDLIDIYWDDLIANAPSQSAYDQFLADLAAFEVAHAAFLADYEAFLEQYNLETAAYQAFLLQHQGVLAKVQAVQDEVAAFNTKAASFDYLYDGVKGSKLFNSLDELLQWIVKLLLGILNPLDPNNVAQNTGQLTLDWNGQCMHAYHNVAFDLRVNQNNDRTGYATGGIIEHNRFFTIGQIRHYDGVFRENEVGNRAFLHQLVNPTVVPSPASARAINNDGANQGWYYNNTIYGYVDLDFHGHHHAPGFFAPQSHYHGSTRTVAYMQNAAGCVKTYDNVTASKAEGPHKDHPTDNDIHAFHIAVVEKSDVMGCLPHFDHGKRWTSVFFNDNILIDPNGIGLRFEDLNHRADDEQANSENMKELKKPHYHQKWVQMEGNTVVGKIFIDVLNAAGTDLWSDDWSAVQNPPGAARIQENLAHPGAEVVNSHQYRNDAWLDIRGNNILATQSTGILVADAADLTLFQLQDNRGFGFPKSYQTGMTPGGFMDWLRSIPSKSTDQVWGEIEAFKGQDRGVQTMTHLAFLRNNFTVEHCGNDSRGLDKGLVATDRIYDDKHSIIRACGTSNYKGANPQVDIIYTPAPSAPFKCTEAWREFTDGTDDFYVSETTFDVLDALIPATLCEHVEAPAPPPDADTPSDPVGYVEDTADAVVVYTTEKLGL